MDSFFAGVFGLIISNFALCLQEKERARGEKDDG